MLSIIYSSSHQAAPTQSFSQLKREKPQCESSAAMSISAQVAHSSEPQAESADQKQQVPGVGGASHHTEPSHEAHSSAPLEQKWSAAAGWSQVAQASTPHLPLSPVPNSHTVSVQSQSICHMVTVHTVTLTHSLTVCKVTGIVRLS